MTVPITVPPGRNKLQPDLSLVYSTGHGNGLFGLGWTLSIPGVARDTTKGIPLYFDAEDVFLLSGAEQLVPTRQSRDGAMLYRPRTEGIFARIEHRISEHADYWEVRSRNGLKSIYGHPAARKQIEPSCETLTTHSECFRGVLTETLDPFGNRIEYLYERDPTTEDGSHYWDQIYLKTIRYTDYGPKDAPQFLATVDFVYDQRPDPFSNCRGGFEVRTTRRCAQIEIRTHADNIQLTRVYRLVYQDQLKSPDTTTNGMSLLRRIEVERRRRRRARALPPA